MVKNNYKTRLIAKMMMQYRARMAGSLRNIRRTYSGTSEKWHCLSFEQSLLLKGLREKPDAIFGEGGYKPDLVDFFRGNDYIAFLWARWQEGSATAENV